MDRHDGSVEGKDRGVARCGVDFFRTVSACFKLWRDLEEISRNWIELSSKIELNWYRWYQLGWDFPIKISQRVPACAVGFDLPRVRSREHLTDSNSNIDAISTRRNGDRLLHYQESIKWVTTSKTFSVFRYPFHWRVFYNPHLVRHGMQDAEHQNNILSVFGCHEFSHINSWKWDFTFFF